MCPAGNLKSSYPFFSYIPLIVKVFTANKGYAINFLCSAKIFDINNLISITGQMIN